MRNRLNFSWLFVSYEPCYAEIYKSTKAVAVATGDSTSTGDALTKQTTFSGRQARTESPVCCAALRLCWVDLISWALPW